METSEVPDVILNALCNPSIDFVAFFVFAFVDISVSVWVWQLHPCFMKQSV